MSLFRPAPIRLALLGTVVLLIDIAAINIAHASTSAAWAAHEKEVVSACAAASNLRDAKPGGSLVDFDDRVGYTAVVIEGHYPQPHMKNQRGRVLCLFDKRTRVPHVADADSMLPMQGP